MITYRYHPDHTEPASHQVFVFGSNLAGRHGKGAALYAAQKCGAAYGNGLGMFGRSYAIPTKDHQLRPLPIDDIVLHIQTFKDFSFKFPQLELFVTRIGCGLAGYRDEDIAPWFAGSNVNCVFPAEWEIYLSNTRLDELYTLYYS